MLGLMLPEEHPVWTDPEGPLPVETGDVARVIKVPGWLLSARRRDGIAVGSTTAPTMRAPVTDARTRRCTRGWATPQPLFLPWSVRR
ncbi:hypothetical protein [Streptomyces himalayensis]|uniref:hypothetical protein n=1 Tax=Streptomyces himalayensis TaxID=2820085 RepID=UPI00215D72F8|nr:hypothetical protein [Streptomyces himalayensis]